EIRSGRRQIQARAPTDLEGRGIVGLRPAGPGHDEARSIIEPQEKSVKRPLTHVLARAVLAVYVPAHNHSLRGPAGEHPPTTRGIEITVLEHARNAGADTRNLPGRKRNRLGYFQLLGASAAAAVLRGLTRRQGQR